MGARTARTTMLFTIAWTLAWVIAHRYLPGSSGPPNGASWALPAAMTTVGAFYLGWRAGPLAFGAIVVSDLGLWPTGAPTGLVLGLAAIHAVVFTVAGTLLRRHAGRDDVEPMADVARFGTVCVAAAAANALLATPLIATTHLLAWNDVASGAGHWMLDDLTGLFLGAALPYVLLDEVRTARSLSELRGRLRPADLTLLAVQLAILGLTIGVAVALAGPEHYPLYVSGIVLAWMALGGRQAAALGSAVVGVAVGIDVAFDGISASATSVEIQAIALAAIALAVGAQADERRRAAAMFRQATADLRLSEALHRAVVEGADDGIVVIDPSGRIKTANGAVRRIFGYSPERAAQLQIADLVPGDGVDAEDHLEYLLESSRMEGAGPYLDGRRVDGTHFPIRLTVSKIVVDGQVAYSAIVRDESTRKSFEDLLEYQATHDPLTKLPNRTLFNDRMRMALELQRREGGPLAVLLIDLDRFKTINDTLGHDVGDQVLVEAAQRLRRSVRRSDTIARLGGDEFVVLCSPLRDEHEAENVARRIVTSMSRPFDEVPSDLDLTASIGVRVTRYANEEPGRLMRDADAAL